MLKRWWCMDCRSAVDLNRHGRCGACESEAVDSFNRGTINSSSPVADVAATGSVSWS